MFPEASLFLFYVKPQNAPNFTSHLQEVVGRMDAATQHTFGVEIQHWLTLCMGRRRYGIENGCMQIYFMFNLYD